MANSYGYDFYFKDGEDVLTFPITPAELSIKVESKNKVVTLISEGDINILKSPSLIEVEFEARFPMRKYPYSREFTDFETYFDKFKELKEKKKSFRFIVARTTPNGKRTWDTNLLMALEDFELKEDADEGDDVLIDFKLKQFKEYGVKLVPTDNSKPETTSTSDDPRSTDNKATEPETYIVKPGDCLWAIAKSSYGNGSLWTKIYEANKSIIESTAKKYGKQSSSNGHWIYPNTELVIPGKTSTSGGTISNTSSKTNATNTQSNKSTKFEILVRAMGDANAKGTVVVSYTENGKAKTLKWEGFKAQRFNVDKGTSFTVSAAPQAGWEILHTSGEGFLAAGANKWIVESVKKNYTLELKWAKK